MVMVVVINLIHVKATEDQNGVYLMYARLLVFQTVLVGEIGVARLQSQLFQQ
jgi:hypothetical protein